MYLTGFSGGSVGKESACNAGDPGSVPWSGISPGEENGSPCQDSCLGNPTDSGAWLATVHGASESDMMGQLNHHHVPKPSRSMLSEKRFIYSPQSQVPGSLICNM